MFETIWILGINWIIGSLCAGVIIIPVVVVFVIILLILNKRLGGRKQGGIE